MKNTDTEPLEIPESELRELYGTLSDATTAASTGDPNECARLAAEAKRHVIKLHEEYA
jgi:hypothetical protein